MLIEEALYQFLMTNLEVTNIVSQRIYPVTMPQATPNGASYPALVFGLERRERRQSHNGPSNLVESGYTVSCLGSGYFETKTLADKVRLALNGQAFGLASVFGKQVKGVFVDNENDDYVYDQTENLSLYHVPLALVIQHEEDLA